MRLWLRTFAVLLVFTPLAAQAQYNDSPAAAGPDMREAGEQLLALANEAREQAGLGRLEWDPALAQAALAHCRRMVAEGPIAHRYGGEPGVAGRAAKAGAHFSIIAENIAVGDSPDQIQTAWMQSPGHRANLLNPRLNHVGIAVVEARGVLYVVADYSRAVEVLTARQVEARVAELLRAHGVAIVPNPSLARAACAMDGGFPPGGSRPNFIVRWQNGSLNQLPKPLLEQLATGQYHRAAVGSCRIENAESFSGYRLAVLLYF